MALPNQPEEFTPDAVASLIAGTALAGTPVDGVHVERIGEGFGLDGVVVRITFPAANASIVAKVCNAAKGRREAGFYERIGPRMPVRLVRLVGSVIEDDADRAVLLFEDLAPAEQGDVLSGADPRRATAVVRAMAGFHGAFAGAAMDDVRDLRAWEPGADKLVEELPVRKARVYERFDALVSARDRAMIDELPRWYADTMPALDDAAATLVHGNLHLDNVLFLSPDEPVILDWPDARRGPGSIDFARFLIEGLRAEQRRAQEPALRDAYLATLHASGGDVSRDRLAAEMRALAVWCVVFGVAWGGAKEPGFERRRVRDIVASLLGNALAAAHDWL